MAVVLDDADHVWDRHAGDDDFTAGREVVRFEE
jgi:hypothetical protein